MKITDRKNGFEFTFVEETRDWLFKALPFIKKEKSVEKPQIEVVNEIEKRYEEEFEKRMKGVVKDISKYLAV